MADTKGLARLSAPYFRSPEKARQVIEKTRWPDGPVCPHCSSSKVYHLEGPRTRAGLYKCGACRRQFTVSIGTIFERSRVPLSKWLAAINRLCRSDRLVSIRQVHMRLGVTYKTAWRMTYLILGALGYKPKRGYPADFTGWDGRIGDGWDWHYWIHMSRSLKLNGSDITLRNILLRILKSPSS